MEKCLKENGHMVIVVAEGAGQELITETMRSMTEKDASGNKQLLDVGHWLSQKIKVCGQLMPVYYISCTNRAKLYQLLSVLCYLTLAALQDHFSKCKRMVINLKYIGSFLFPLEVVSCHFFSMVSFSTLNIDSNTLYSRSYLHDTCCSQHCIRQYLLHTSGS